MVIKWCGLESSASMALDSLDLLQQISSDFYGLWSLLSWTSHKALTFFRPVCLNFHGPGRNANCSSIIHNTRDARCLMGVVWEKTSCGRGRFDAWRRWLLLFVHMQRVVYPGNQTRRLTLLCKCCFNGKIELWMIPIRASIEWPPFLLLKSLENPKRPIPASANKHPNKCFGTPMLLASNILGDSSVNKGDLWRPHLRFIVVSFSITSIKKAIEATNYHQKSAADPPQSSDPEV